MSCDKVCFLVCCFPNMPVDTKDCPHISTTLSVCLHLFFKHSSKFLWLGGVKALFTVTWAEGRMCHFMDLCITQRLYMAGPTYGENNSLYVVCSSNQWVPLPTAIWDEPPLCFVMQPPPHTFIILVNNITNKCHSFYLTPAEYMAHESQASYLKNWDNGNHVTSETNKYAFTGNTVDLATCMCTYSCCKRLWLHLTVGSRRQVTPESLTQQVTRFSNGQSLENLC